MGDCLPLPLSSAIIMIIILSRGLLQLARHLARHQVTGNFFSYPALMPFFKRKTLRAPFSKITQIYIIYFFYLLGVIAISQTFPPSGIGYDIVNDIVLIHINAHVQISVQLDLVSTLTVLIYGFSQG